ncbi:MAG: winged helix-turn-helix transcriptional regulator [Myxococcales bacterium]|nr:winged helix-turn-helix transcriptional regulator [Myxococcales bacterium]MCB9731824.1 winged helix-turn-helix transcriptional regulator [Deltaproteobacteria bacterium]
MLPNVHPLDALGNPVRRDILRELRLGPRAVNDLASAFTVSRPAISRHLQMLRSAGLVEARQRGTEHLYAVRLQGFQEVRAYLDEFWDVALSRLAALAQAEAHGEGGERSSDRREPEAS